MTVQFIWQGCLVGLLAAVPLGPMGMLRVQRAMAHGRRTGLASATGLTVAAALWCVVAVQGLSVVTGWMQGSDLPLCAGLGVFLVVAGLHGFMRTRGLEEITERKVAGGLASAFASAFMGVALNPVTFVTLTAVLAILHVVKERLSPGATTGLAVAVFLGGMSLWVGLTHGLVGLRRRLGTTACTRIRVALNICIVLVGMRQPATSWI